MPKLGSLASKIKAHQLKPKAKREPLWLGPEDASERGGVTQSLLGRFLTCRERFRLKVIDGLTTADHFSQRLEYGNLWCAAEEEFKRTKGSDDNWARALLQYAKQLAQRYPLQGEQVEHWYNVCKVQFPIYHQYWSKQPDVKDRKPIFQEQVFHVPYKLPSGRIVYLRGKWDGVDLIGKGNNAGIWVQEDKTKGEIDQELMRRNLTFDLQTMLYTIALQYAPYDSNPEVRSRLNATGLREPWKHIKGVRYNVIRRPLSGGKGSIVQKKPTKGAKCSKCKGTGQVGSLKALPKLVAVKTNCPKCNGVGRIGAEPGESDTDFYNRLGMIIKGASGPEWGVGPKENYFFMRWKVDIFPGDIEKFKNECLNPILEQLCDWYEYILNPTGYGWTSPHFRMPYGVYSPLLDGKPTEVDEYLSSGSKLGLVQSDNLFPELQ